MVLFKDGGILVIPNKRFSYYSTSGCDLRCFSPDKFFYSKQISIRVGSVEEYNELQRIFRDNGFTTIPDELNDQDRLPGERTYIEPREFLSCCLDRIKRVELFGETYFKVFVSKERVQKFLEILDLLSSVYNYKTDYSIYSCNGSSLMIIK